MLGYELARKRLLELFDGSALEGDHVPQVDDLAVHVLVVRAVSERASGYHSPGQDVRVVRNPTKADIIRTLNQLSVEIGSNDSVVVYYAGHGYSLQKNGAGYWLPADAQSSDPGRWISNGDVARLLSGIRSSQMVLISDSCYSGAFARDVATFKRFAL